MIQRYLDERQQMLSIRTISFGSSRPINNSAPARLKNSIGYLKGISLAFRILIYPEHPVRALDHQKS